MQIRLLPLQLLTSLVLSFGLLPLAAQAQSRGTVDLRDGNSSVRLSLDNLGIDAWTVDRVNQVFSTNAPDPRGPFGEQYFLNLANDALPGEVSLRSFRLNSVEQRSERALTAYLTGLGGILDFQYDLEIDGGKAGSGFSRRYETVTLFNRSGITQELSLFSYIDFDIAGTFENDSLLIQGNRLEQTDVSGVKATVTVDQRPDFVQADVYPILLTEFFNGSKTTLNGRTSLNSRDASAAFQFNRTLAPGESIAFRFYKQLGEKDTPQDVPEPMSAIALAVLAGTAFAVKLKNAR